METLLRDVRYGLRMLRKAPGFTAVAVLTLALGIGANTTIFSAVNGILLEALPYAGSSRLVKIGSSNPVFGDTGLSLPAIHDVQEQLHVFQQTAYYSADSGADILGGSSPDAVSDPQVSSDFFTMLGVRPLLGRPILPVDTQPGHNDVVVLNYALWLENFAGDSRIVGKTVTLNKKLSIVIGVMPPEFNLGIDRGHGVWLPLVTQSGSGAGRAGRDYLLLARLQQGLTLKEINSQLKALSARLAADYPNTDKGWEMMASSMRGEMVGGVQTGLLILLAAVAFVLLITCVNVSALLLARSLARQREIAIREALGATRVHIVRQLLVESLLLSLTGGALGLLVSVWGIRVLRLMAPPTTPRIEHLRLNANVLWFTLAISIFAGILSGLAPVIQTSIRRTGVALDQVRGDAFTGLVSLRSRRLRDALVVSEVTLAVILVIGGALTARSLQKLMSVNLGYRTDHILTLAPSFQNSGCDSRHPQLCQNVMQESLRRIQALPGIESAAISGSAPLDGAFAMVGLQVEGLQPENGPQGLNWYQYITPGYFHVMGIPLLNGRDFRDADVKNSKPVAIVNQAFAQQYFQNRSPLGQRLSANKDKNGRPEWMRIVGEVADSRNYAIKEAPVPEYYVPLAQQADSMAVTGGSFLVRTRGNPMAIAAAAREQIWDADKDAPITNLRTMDQIVAARTAEPRFQTLLLGGFGALGFLLAIVGIYGVISYNVSQRTREIGMRMALGAQPGHIVRMVLGEGLLLALIGIVVGVGGALGLTRFVRSLLFEVKPTDPATFIGVAVLLALVALAACYIPARRAMRVDPMVALRYE